MDDLDFLRGEARIASAFAPDGLSIEVRDGGRGRFDILFGGEAVSRLLGREAALACVMGIGGALAVLSRGKAESAPPRGAPGRRRKSADTPLL